MIKRFFLRSGAEPIAIGCWPLLAFAFITFFIGLFLHYVLILFGFFVIGWVIWIIVCLTIDNRHIFPSGGEKNYLALKVKDGRVVEASNRFWKEEGYEYHMVTLPEITGGTFKVVGYLPFKKKGMSIEVKVPLVCHVEGDEEVFAEGVPRNGFYPQEIYDFVILGGLSNTSDMIKKFFEKVAGNDPAVKKAFEEHHSDALELKPALAKALKQLSFSLPLSNIIDINVTIRRIGISLRSQD